METNIFYKQLNFSTIDYPGEISTVLFCKKCSMRCSYCYNLKELSRIKTPIENKEILDYLYKRKEFLTGVVLSGGEVLLDEYIKTVYKMLFKIKEMGYQVKIDTNGLHPNNLKLLLDHGLVDYVAMDVKCKDSFIHPSKSRFYDKIFGLNYNSPQLNTFNEIVKSRVPYELRTTMVHPFISKEDMIDIAKLLLSETQTPLIENWYLQEAKLFYDILDPEYPDMRVMTTEEIEEVKNVLERFVHLIKIR